jgi:hypothetical protein
MRLVSGHDEAVWEWANKFFETPLQVPTWALGIIDDQGVLKGALLGDERTETTVEVTICSEDNAITLDIAKAFFAAVFGRYWRLQVRTTKDNKIVKRNAPKWGFTFEGTAKDYWGPGRSALLYCMTKPNCRWIKNHGR